jgi:hypothetical protein
MEQDAAMLHLQEQLGGMVAELSKIDEIGQIVLNGQIQIESHIDDILAVIFFHPEHILTGLRIDFERKVRIVRAYSLRTHNWPPWDLILAFSQLRNAIAHTSDGEKRQERMGAVRSAFFKTRLPGRLTEFDGANDRAIALVACASCSGFLQVLEDEMRRLRRHIDDLDAELNPEAERFSPPPSKYGNDDGSPDPDDE